MRAIWKGSISFGLVNIPVAVHPATRREELKFRLLRASDLSPINYRRVAEADGKEVPWGQIVKGYEYEKGRFVVLKEEDFKRVDLEATDTVDIVDFVKQSEINPIYFYKPYYLEPQKGGAGAYTLLRDVLAETGKVGISKVIIRNRQHLAAVKASGPALILELMHFAHEIVDVGGLNLPGEAKAGKREVEVASALVERMTDGWNPEKYTDDYVSAVMKLIREKIEAGGKEVPGARHKAKPATNVIDLVSVLQQSLDAAGGRSKASGRKAASPKRTRHRPAAHRHAA